MGKLCGRREAARHLGVREIELWKAADHIIAAGSTPCNYGQEVPVKSARRLRLKTRNGVKYLKFRSGLVDQQTLRGVRELDGESALILDQFVGELIELAPVDQTAPEAAVADVTEVLKGAGFGTPEQNRKVEGAATDFVESHYTEQGWGVEKVSQQNLGYDLLCTRKTDKVLHVEVKGVSGTTKKFIITENEKRKWSEDKRFVLALVTNALNTRRRLLFQYHKADFKKFDFCTTAYFARFEDDHS